MTDLRRLGFEFSKAIRRAVSSDKNVVLEENCQSVSTCKSIPHWCICIVVKNIDKKFFSPESLKKSVKSRSCKTYRVAHVDVCKASFDESGFAKPRDGKTFSLLTLVTLNVRYSEHTESVQALRFSFNANIRFGLQQDGTEWSEYEIMRHLRFLNLGPLRGLELCTLKTYTLFNNPYVDEDIMMTSDRWKIIVQCYIDSLMPRLSKRIVVRAQDPAIRKVLNGERGVIEGGLCGETVRKGISLVI